MKIYFIACDTSSVLQGGLFSAPESCHEGSPTLFPISPQYWSRIVPSRGVEL